MDLGDAVQRALSELRQFDGEVLAAKDAAVEQAFPGSTVELRSGMAFQVDVIPATGTDYFTTNIEDGIVLADDALRDELARLYPDLWSRVERRRAFMSAIITARGYAG